MKYSIEWLLANHNDTTEYLCFWGHTPSKDGSITKTCFSQWWESPFTVEGKIYKTAEHWMMVGKAQLFGDFDMIEDILNAEKPAVAKALGRKVRNFDEGVWNERRFDIVVQGNVHKFAQNPKLKAFLMATKGKVIVEASPMDRIWGIGFGPENPKATQPWAWRGQNLLGFALMEARDLLE